MFRPSGAKMKVETSNVKCTQILNEGDIVTLEYDGFTRTTPSLSLSLFLPLLLIMTFYLFYLFLFSFLCFLGLELPSNPTVTRVRRDVTWRDIVGDYARNVAQQNKLNGIKTNKQKSKYKNKQIKQTKQTKQTSKATELII